MDKTIKKNLIDSYQTNGGFIVYTREMLEKIFKAYGIDPKTSTDRRIFDIEGVVHFFQRGIVNLFNKLDITSILPLILAPPRIAIKGLSGFSTALPR